MLISGVVEYFTSDGPGTQIKMGDFRAFNYYSSKNTGRAAKDQLVEQVDLLYRSDLLPPWDARIVIHDMVPAPESVMKSNGYFMAYQLFR